MSGSPGSSPGRPRRRAGPVAIPLPTAESAEPSAGGSVPGGGAGGGGLARFVTWNILGIAGSLLIGFGVSIALARWLGPSDRGLLALMLSVGSIAMVLTGAGMPIGVVYFASRRAQDGPGILGNCLLQGGLIAAVLIPASLLLQHPIADALGRGHGGRTWVLAAALVPITFLDWTIHSQLQGRLQFGRYNVLLIGQRITYAAGVLILLGILKLGVASALIATAAGSLLMIAGAMLPILALGRPWLDLPLMRRMLNYGSRAQVGSLLQLANGRLDVIILQFFRPLSQVGYYVVAQAIAELVVQFADAFQWSNMALVSREDGLDPESASSALAIRHHVLISALLVLGNAAFGSLVILFAYGPAFHRAVLPMLILLPGVWLLGISFVVQGDLNGRGRPGLASALSGGAAVVTVILDFALIPPFGVIGAAIASVCVYSTLGISSLIALSRVSGLSLRTLALPTRADVLSYVEFVRRFARRRYPAADGLA